ncbi:MAG: flagellar basal body P-ring protein FlgI [Deltaproteobacteria bacterium]|nr:flagellar basal body P-ring protein FlgI [Deltaproteobacteria bacterium]
MCERTRSRVAAPRARAAVAALLIAGAFGPRPAAAERLKDVADLRGARPNRLLGYGLVVGLGGTGDDTTAPFSAESAMTMLRRLGVHVDDQRLRLRNVAAVMVTTEMPAFVAAGQRLDATVSSVGNATSLEGGTLLATPLKGLDLQVYAVAEGPLSVGGYLASGNTGSRVQKNHTTVGRIPGGALVEREVAVNLGGHEMLINLRSPDFTTAARVAAAIGDNLAARAPAIDGTPPPAATEDGAPPEGAAAGVTDTPWAIARDAGTVVVRVPDAYRNRVPALMAELEGLEVSPDTRTRVVINERTGTVVLGDGVRLLPVAIAHGGLTLEVQEALIPSQPAPFGRGRTVVVPSTRVQARETAGLLKEVTPSASLSDVVRALNALGVSPRDLVAILQALKASGALRAELEIQ